MKRCLRLCALTYLIAAGATQSAAQTPDVTRRLRIMFVGNSYTYVNDLPKSLQTLASKRSPPVRVEIGTVLVGGRTLKGHWEDSTALALIQAGSWDYVVLQEQSLQPIQMPDTFIKYGRLFGKAIRAAGAKPLLYVTWNRKGRPAAQDSLTRAYARLAREIDAEFAPVGPAWTTVQKLDPATELYDADGSHPSLLGTYVAAAVFYRLLFNALPSTDQALVYRTTYTSAGQLERVEQVRVPSRSAELIHHAVDQVFNTAQGLSAQLQPPPNRFRFFLRLSPETTAVLSSPPPPAVERDAAS